LIRSMTGFGEAGATVEGVHYFVEVRSLNSRYFKSIIRLPDEFQGLEAEVESVLRRRLTRGTVTCVVSISDSSETAVYTINHRALAGYIAQVQATPQVASGVVKIDLGPLLALPGVLQPPADEEARIDRTRAAVLPLLERACDGLMEMRRKEGQMLVEELRLQRDVMAEQLKKVESRAPQVIVDFEKRLRNKVELLLKDAGVAVETVDLIREIALYADRTDIREETTRLGGHIQQFTTMLASGDGKPIGRTMDFLTQEMLREANTMGAKSADGEISKAIVEIKGAIDRIKEQVQNIE
jgi:uncharacterized protein (TIGR00255 family)